MLDFSNIGVNII